MRILHSSDWHLGAGERNRSLKEDQLFFLKEIYRVIEEENIDLLLIAGDVFDRAVSSAEAISLYDDAMTHICNDLGKKVLIIAGNHDSAERLSSCSSLLKKAGLYVTGAITAEPAVVSIEDVDFYMLPWFTEDKVKSLYPDRIEEIHGMNDAYRIVCDKCRETFEKDRKHIALSHAFITGAELSESDRAAGLAVVGLATQVSAQVFEGFDYVALGHIHKPQNVKENIRYSGTPMPYSFGVEEQQVKSVTIIDTADMSQKIVPLKLLHKRTTLKDCWEKISEADYPEEVKKGYLKVVVTDEYVGYEKASIINSLYENVIDMTGKDLDDGNASISLSMEEFVKLENDPMQIFKAFYRESYGEETPEHYIKLFEQCMDDLANGRFMNED